MRSTDARSLGPSQSTPQPGSRAPSLHRGVPPFIIDVVVPKNGPHRIVQWTIAFGLAIAPLFVASHISALATGHPALADLAVFREAAKTVISGRSLFSSSFGHSLAIPLSFTYPPFAAIFFLPLAAISLQADSIIWWAVSLAAVAISVKLCFRSLLVRAKGAQPLVLGALVCMFLITDPFRAVMSFGQIGAGLLALVLLDCLSVRTRWPRGALVGLATAIKLVPGLFIVYFLVTRRWREAATAISVFLSATLLSLIVLPSDTRKYWAHLVFDAKRVGGVAYYSNQSLYGVVQRLGHSSLSNSLWIALCVLALVIAYVGVRRADQAGDDLTAVAIVGVASTLVSPISWIHHLVWIVPAVAAIAKDLRSTRRVVLALGVIAFFSLHMPELGSAMAKINGASALSELLEDFFAIGSVTLLILLTSHKPEPAEELGSTVDLVLTT